MRRLRNEMEAAGIPIENSKGEWGPGQEEINVRYAEVLEMADRHVILKNGAKEIAASEGKAISFMSKYNYGLAGNSSHIHNSLWSADGKTPLFYEKGAEWTLSKLGQQWSAGQLKYAKEFTWFLAPYINSYKRFQSGTFAPTKIMWSEDNRTAGFRLCGEGTKGIRMECRIGGADLNPYLAFAALIAAGLAGIDEKLELQKPFVGDAYQAASLPEIPKTLRDATETLASSKMLREALGEEVVDHYVHTARWEQFEYDRRITDWELHRGFERRRANLPQGLFQNLLLDHAQTAAIIASARVQQVNFTGSVDAGKAMENAASGRFLGMGLELGGKDPAYVRADANLEYAVENLVDGSFFNSGQSCCAVERIYVDQKIYPEFVERFVELTRQYVLGNPLDEATTLGPLVTPGAAFFVRGQIAEAVAQGAKAMIDPQAFAADVPGSAYLAPQVLVDVTHQMSVMRDESFGPVVGIMPVASDEEAIALMNDSEFGLSASIWTQDVAAAEHLGNAIDTGTVFMNRCDYLDPALAWTGVKNSGRGVTLSRLGYEHLTRAKSFHLRHEI
jgi:hypothetical protein